ncbi:MAG TPA: PEGA domain-containing protein [Thermoanaerobaculia bacterium]|nr:PEGA domain-containing protein [Thermoanaerobaculia bacterium]
MRQLLCSLFILAVAGIAGAAPPALRIGDPKTKGFSSPVGVSAGRQWWGEIAQFGEVLDLTAGSYELLLRYPPHSLYLNIVVSGTDVKVTKWREGEADCGVTIRDKVADWTVTVRQNKGIVELQIPPPSLEKTPYERRSDCSLGDWTTVKNISISVSSEPKGADIFLDKRKIGVTDATIVAPLVEYRDGIYVTVRKTGFATCIRRVDASATTADAKCQLRLLP